MEGVKLVKIGREACPRCKVWDNMLENQFPDLEIQHINVDFERENITMEMATALRGQTALPFLLIEKDG